MKSDLLFLGNVELMCLEVRDVTYLGFIVIDVDFVVCDGESVCLHK